MTTFKESIQFDIPPHEQLLNQELLQAEKEYGDKAFVWAITPQNITNQRTADPIDYVNILIRYHKSGQIYQGIFSSEYVTDSLIDIAYWAKKGRVDKVILEINKLKKLASIKQSVKLVKEKINNDIQTLDLTDMKIGTR
jgi:hypothetical protein